MSVVDYLRRLLNRTRPPIRPEVRADVEHFILDDGHLLRTAADAEAVASAAASLSGRADEEVASSWAPGEPVPEGWVECLPGPHIRRIDVDDPFLRHGGLIVGHRPFARRNERVLASVGDRRPVVVRGRQAS